MALNLSAFGVTDKPSGLNLSAFGVKEAPPGSSLPYQDLYQQAGQEPTGVQPSTNFFGTSDTTPQQTDFSSLNLVKGLGQGLARIPAEFAVTAGQAGLSAVDKAAGTEYTARTDAGIPTGDQSWLLGEEPIKGYGSHILDLSEAIQKSPIAQKYGLDKKSLPIAFAGVLGEEALNFFGGEAKGAKAFLGTMKSIPATEQGVTDAYRIARAAGFDHDIAAQYAPLWAKEGTAKGTEEITNAAVKLQNTTKASSIFPKANIEAGAPVPPTAPVSVGAQSNTQDISGSITTGRFGKVNLLTGEIPVGESTGFGQAKINQRVSLTNEEAAHLMDTLPIKSESSNRIILEDDNYRILISKDWNGKPISPWLMNVIPKNVVRGEGVEPTTSVVSGLRSAAELPASRKPTTGGLSVNEAERGFITSVKDFNPNLEARVAGQYVPRSTDALSQQAANLIKDNIGAAEQLARTGTDEKAVATSAELIKKYTADAAATTDKALQDVLYDKAADIANVISKKLTEQGRAVQAASILSRLTPEGELRFAAKQIQDYNAEIIKGGGGFLGLKKQIPELSGEQAKAILDEAKRIQAMPDGFEKARAYNDLQEQIGRLVPTPWFKKAIAVWKAGLLTGIKTSGLNTLANLSHGVSEIAKDVPAAAVDSIASFLSGKRTLTLTGKGTGSGMVEGLKKGWQYLRTGYDERNITEKFDIIKKVNFGNSKFAKGIQAYEETVFKLMGAEDQPFYYGAKARSIMSQAYAQAKNTGLKGVEAKEFVTNLVQNPTDEMLKYATLDAQTAVFQNNTKLAEVAAAMVRAVPALEIVMPFRRTPAAVAMQVINYSPLGLAKPVARIFGAIRKGTFDQRLFSQEVGRAAIGTVAVAVGAALYKHGLLSLGKPTGEAEQKQWELEGRTANSIKIGGKWRSSAVLGAVGLTAVAGGYFEKGLQQTGSVMSGLVQAGASMGTTLNEQTFLKGVNSITTTLADPSRSAEALVSSTISSVVPTIVGDFARATDKEERSFSGSLTGQLQAKIPGAREKLQPQINTFGQPIKTMSFLEVMADPTRPASTEYANDPVVMELRRLSDAGTPATPTQLGNKKGYSALTPAQNTDLWVRSGTLLKDKLDALIQMPEYQKLSDEQKAKLIQNFTDKAKTVARTEVVLHLTQGLQGDALKNELAKLKQSGLLTRDVFDQWVELR